MVEVAGPPVKLRFLQTLLQYFWLSFLSCTFIIVRHHENIRHPQGARHVHPASDEDHLRASEEVENIPHLSVTIRGVHPSECMPRVVVYNMQLDNVLKCMSCMERASTWDCRYLQVPA